MHLREQLQSRLMIVRAQHRMQNDVSNDCPACLNKAAEASEELLNRLIIAAKTIEEWRATYTPTIQTELIKYERALFGEVCPTASLDLKIS